ncbi:MAG: type VI secretion system ATPase TssH, partial [SAR324 cluster bacterium]|nr:type VI secretion system ATPase TssH [SAR324 cluster bacterium]
MKIDQLTEKSQEALQDAQAAALKLGHGEIGTLHLLLALLEQPDGLVPRILEKAGREVAPLVSNLRNRLAREPQVSGGGRKLSASVAFNEALLRAEAEAHTFGDEYLSTEHLLLGLLAEGKGGPAGQVLAESGVEQAPVMEALKAVRGNRRVTSPTPETGYEALEKYGRDLTRMATDGKLDPVVGRDEEIRRIITVLSRRTKNNPVLIGEPGVGKTAIVEGL